MQHLLIGCSFSRMVWHEVFSTLRLTSSIPLGHEPFFDWWKASTSSAPPSLRKGTASLVIIVAWTLWKHRNACTFDGIRPLVTDASRAALAEAATWATAGAKGLHSFVFEPP